MTPPLISLRLADRIHENPEKYERRRHWTNNRIRIYIEKKICVIEDLQFSQTITCNMGTLSGGKICLMRSSVHLGLSRLPMFVTLKLRKLLDFDRKWVRLVRLMCDKRST